MIKEPALARQSAAVAREVAVACYDAVAGDHDRQVVHPIRAPDRARSASRADRCRLLPVASRLAEGDLPQVVPRPALEDAALWCERNLECLARPAEVFVQLAFQLNEVTMLARCDRRAVSLRDPRVRLRLLPRHRSVNMR